MTRTEKLIAKLDAAQNRFLLSAIIVKSDDAALFINADDPDRLRRLDEALTAGGKPIGLIGINKEGTKCFHQAFPGCGRDKAGLAFLAQLQLAQITGDFGTLPPDVKLMYQPYIVQ